jgi:mannose-6-phosphate isomerase
VFAEGARLGVARSAEARDLGLAWLRAARQPDGGYPSRFDLANRPLDEGRDLYDHAFVLFAFAKAGARADAMALLTYLQAHFRHPLGGWRESLPDALPRRQNPHMHLLEAVLAAHEAFGDKVWLEIADELVTLFLDRLYQPLEGALAEYFTDDLKPLREEGCYRLEPGHHHEWVWLLAWHRRRSGAAGRPVRETTVAAAALLAFAERHGVDADGEIAAELWSDGRPASAVTRIWPYTERLKALAVAGDAGRLQAGCAALGRCLAHPVAGLWHERRGAAGFEPNVAAPASSLYHIACAILEISEERL